jgi:hypothetical protein
LGEGKETKRTGWATRPEARSAPESPGCAVFAFWGGRAALQRREEMIKESSSYLPKASAQRSGAPRKQVEGQGDYFPPFASQRNGAPDFLVRHRKTKSKGGPPALQWIQCSLPPPFNSYDKQLEPWRALGIPFGLLPLAAQPAPHFASWRSVRNAPRRYMPTFLLPLRMRYHSIRFPSSP